MGVVKKVNVRNIVIAAVVLVLAVVGLIMSSQAWLTMKMDDFSETGKLSEIRESMKALKDFGGKVPGKYTAMNAFEILTMIFMIVTIVAACAQAFLDIKAVKYVALAVGAVTAVFAILMLVFTFVYGNSMLGETAEAIKAAKEAGASCVPAIGAWMMAICGVLAGAGTVVLSRFND